MFNSVDEIKIVILDSFYDNPDDPIVQLLYSKIGALKINGYLNGSTHEKYPYGTLPFDATDVFGTHIIACHYQNHTLTPLVAFKSLSFNRARQFNYDFPALKLAKDNGSTSCLSVMQELISTHFGNVSWDSSWTILPQVRENYPKAQLILLQLTAMLLVKFHLDYSDCPYWLTCGIPRVGSDKFFLRMGLEPVGDAPGFNHPQLSGEKAVMLFLKQYSRYADQLTQRHESLWNKKIVIPATQSKDFLRKEVEQSLTV